MITLIVIIICALGIYWIFREAFRDCDSCRYLGQTKWASPYRRLNEERCKTCKVGLFNQNWERKGGDV